MFHDRIFSSISFNEKREVVREYYFGDGEEFHHFIMPWIDPEDRQNLADTGLEFYRNGFLEPPFNLFTFSFNDGKRQALLSCKNLKGSGISVHCIFQDNDDKSGFHVPRFFGVYNKEKDGMHLIGFSGEYEEEHRSESDTKDAGWDIAMAFAYLMMLNTKYARKEGIVIDKKLNKKREKNGKPRLSDYTVVKLTEKKASDLGGTHASPIPHWRRGHIRHLQDGRIIPIPPCIVNWDGETVPEKKTYVVAA